MPTESGLVQLPGSGTQHWPALLEAAKHEPEFRVSRCSSCLPRGDSATCYVSGLQLSSHCWVLFHDAVLPGSTSNQQLAQISGILAASAHSSSSPSSQTTPNCQQGEKLFSPVSRSVKSETFLQPQKTFCPIPQLKKTQTCADNSGVMVDTFFLVIQEKAIISMSFGLGFNTMKIILVAYPNFNNSSPCKFSWMTSVLHLISSIYKRKNYVYSLLRCSMLPLDQ